jgi:hypothetical protein
MSSFLSNLASSTQSPWLQHLFGSNQNQNQSIDQALQIALSMIQADRSRPDMSNLPVSAPPDLRPLAGAPSGGSGPIRRTTPGPGRLPDRFQQDDWLTNFYNQQEADRRGYYQNNPNAAASDNVNFGAVPSWVEYRIKEGFNDDPSVYSPFFGNSGLGTLSPTQQPVDIHTDTPIVTELNPSYYADQGPISPYIPDTIYNFGEQVYE